jgi:hypothetical protein
MMRRFDCRQTGIAGSDSQRVDTDDRAIRNAACSQDWIEVGAAQQPQRCRLRRASDEHDTVSIAASRCNSGYDVRNVLGLTPPPAVGGNAVTPLSRPAGRFSSAATSSKT